jgi:hypothetical protein
MEPASTSVATSASTAAGTGLGIGKILAGIVSVAALAGVGWWATQADSGSADVSPITQQSIAPATGPEETAGLARSTVPASTPGSEQAKEGVAGSNTGEIAAPANAPTDSAPSADLDNDNPFISPTDHSDPNGGKQPPLANDEPFVSPTNDYGDRDGGDSEPSTAGSVSGTVNGPSRTYNTIKVADIWWTKENLSVPGGVCYNSDNSNCTRYGALYTWGAAQNACESLSPGNWRLPTPEEWLSLQYEGALAKMNLKKGGFAVANENTESLGQVGLYWSLVGEAAIEFTGDNLVDAGVPPEFMISCRCVRD